MLNKIKIKNIAEPNFIKVKQKNKCGVVVGKNEPRCLLPLYKDSYTIVPSITEQILQTSNKSMSLDIVVDKIPYAEVSNEFNGTTVIIG